MKSTSVIKFVIVPFFLGVSGAIHAGGAHDHSSVTVYAIYHKDTLSIRVTVPAMLVLGFERAPQTAQEHEQVQRSLNSMNDGTTTLVLNESSSCIQDGPFRTSLPKFDGEHSDYSIAMSFKCKSMPNKFRLALPEEWSASVHQVQFQTGGQLGQTSRKLKYGANFVLKRQ